MESLADRNYCFVTLHSVCQTHLFTYSKKVLIKCIHTNTEPHLNTEFTFFDSMGKEPVFETPKNADELQKALNSFFNSGEGAENA